MRRWTRPSVLAVAVAFLAACGGGADGAAEDRSAVEATALDDAVAVAQLSLPADVSDAVVERLVRDLCSAAGTGDVTPVVQQIHATSSLGESGSALDALAAGAGTYCPEDDVDGVVPKVAEALAPPAPAAPAGGGSAADVSTSPAAGSSGGGTTSGGTTSGADASNSSSGAGVVGGGNATGAGNQSGTDFTQSVSGGSGSNNSTTG